MVEPHNAVLLTIGQDTSLVEVPPRPLNTQPSLGVKWARGTSPLLMHASPTMSALLLRAENSLLCYPLDKVTEDTSSHSMLPHLSIQLTCLTKSSRYFSFSCPNHSVIGIILLCYLFFVLFFSHYCCWTLNALFRIFYFFSDQI